MRWPEIIERGFLAGMMIAIACTLYLSVQFKIVGALLFSVALYVIIDQKLFLFTGKSGAYLNGEFTTIELYSMFFINVAAAMLMGYLISLTNPEITDMAKEMMEAKKYTDPSILFVKSVFCGVLMAFAVEAAKNDRWWITGMCVATFILCGFEHCIAMAGYMGLSGDILMIGNVALVAIGNFIGSALVYTMTV